MSEYTGKIISIVIGLLLAGILLPIGLSGLEAFTSTDSTIQTLVSSVLPIMGVLAIVLMFIGKTKKA